MAINIDDSLRNRALNILNNEQNELDGSFDRQSVAGKSPGMESEYIKETTFFTREELQVKQNADGTWNQTKKKNKNKYYDEGVVDDKEKEFKENAETLQEVCKAYDNEIIRLNGLINAKKVEIKTLSDTALGLGATTLSRGIGPGIGTTTPITWNNDVEFIKIYRKMAGPDFDDGAENPFDPDDTIELTPKWAGYGYKNKKDSQVIIVGDSGSSNAIGIVTDGSGSGIGTDGTVVIISTLASDHPPFNANTIVGYGSDINLKYNEILDLRAERDSYRKKINTLKKNKSEKELMHWGYQNTKSEKKRRKRKNNSSISALKELDSQTDIVEEGLVLHLDAGDNSSYFGSGSLWYDISRDDYDDNGSITGATYVGDTLYPERSYFNFDGAGDYVSFDITDSLFGNPTTVTVEMLAQLTIDETVSDENGYLMFSWGNQKYSVWTGQKVANLPPALGYTTANGDLYGLTKQQVDSLGLNLDGAWKHYIFEMKRDVSYTNNKIYINGVEQPLQQLSNIGDNLNTWTPILTSNMSQDSNDTYKFVKTTNNASWNGRVYSEESFNTAFTSAKADNTSSYIMFGLTADPTASTSYSTIDYAWYFNSGGSLYIYENGSSINPSLSWNANTVLSIIYDGTDVRYYRDGVLVRTRTPTHGSNPLYFSSSTYSTSHPWRANFWEYTNDSGTENASNRTFNLGSGTIANDAYEMPMGVSMFKVYNRALTQDEIDVNFQEVRDRFNL